MTGDVATGAASARLKLADLQPKTKLQGKVKKIELFGAFVDVGAEKDGLLHISQLRKERTNRVEDVVNVGQEVTVWVRNVDAKAGRIDLTLLEPFLLDWDDLKLGRVVTGTVNRMEKFGAFVEIGAERPAFIHVREMMQGRVDDPSDVVKMGQAVEAKVIAVDRQKRRIDLSMKALDDYTPEEDAPDEKPLTAMELALRQAMQGQAGPRDDRRKKKNKSTKPELEDVFERTLKHHAANKG
ncbi:MAG: S1 RNA-binding domain-containing protein [Chloroflexi bacterium]|nr:S1 RNA-binding domain-containing protein [Chloroflexota bacterium]